MTSWHYTIFQPNSVASIPIITLFCVKYHTKQSHATPNPPTSSNKYKKKKKSQKIYLIWGRRYIAHAKVNTIYRAGCCADKRNHHPSELAFFTTHNANLSIKFSGKQFGLIATTITFDFFWIFIYLLGVMLMRYFIFYSFGVVSPLCAISIQRRQRMV